MLKRDIEILQNEKSLPILLLSLSLLLLLCTKIVIDIYENKPSCTRNKLSKGITLLLVQMFIREKRRIDKSQEVELFRKRREEEE